MARDFTTGTAHGITIKRRSGAVFFMLAQKGQYSRAGEYRGRTVVGRSDWPMSDLDLAAGSVYWHRHQAMSDGPVSVLA